MRCMPFYVLAAALKVVEVIRCVLLCMLEAVEGRLYLLEVPEAMRRVQVLCVEGGFCCGVSKFLLWQFSRCGPPPSPMLFCGGGAVVHRPSSIFPSRQKQSGSVRVEQGGRVDRPMPTAFCIRPSVPRVAR